MFYKAQYAGELPLWIEIAAWIIIIGLIILFIRCTIKKLRFRKFQVEGKITQMMNLENNSGKIVYEIFITRFNGEVQRYLTDKKIYQSLEKGDLVRATVCNEKIIHIEPMENAS